MVNAWSFSVLDSYETCPWRHYQIKVLKEVVESQTPEMAWGLKVHKAIENRIAYETPLPDGMTQWEPIAVALLDKRRTGAKVSVEKKLAVDNQFRPCSYFAKDAAKNNMVWVRGQTDADVERGSKATVFDWKTGKPKDNSDQLKLMAAMTFAHKPYVHDITTAFVWLKFPDLPPTVQTFKRADLPAIWGEFLPRVARLDHAMAENVWPKKPSGLCRAHCPVPRSRCEHRG